MNITDLKERQDIVADAKLNEAYLQFEKMLNELKKKSLTDDVLQVINEDVNELNITDLTGKDFKKLLKKKETKIIKLVEKGLKIVPKNYYRNLWLVLGMSSFGLPIGVAFGLCLKNMGLLGLGLPFGTAIGAFIGTRMDKKAFEEGRQLDLEIKY